MNETCNGDDDDEPWQVGSLPSLFPSASLTRSILLIGTTLTFLFSISFSHLLSRRKLAASRYGSSTWCDWLAMVYFMFGSK